MGRSSAVVVESAIMGRNKSNKQNPAAKTETENTSNFVPIVACNYCDAASFDVNDRKSYSDHLKKAHTIQKNIETLIELTLKIQSVDLDPGVSTNDENNKPTKDDAGSKADTLT